MFRILLALIIIIPALEIGVLLISGHMIGVGWTILLIVATGVIGAWLAKQQGTEVIRLAQVQIRNGDVPSDAILEGICVLAGGILLLAPGFITDFVGFCLLFPYTRGILKIWLRKWFRRMIHFGGVSIFFRR